MASLNCPLIEASLDDKHSIKCPNYNNIINIPIVILDGIQCGLIVKSGDIPRRVNGKSSYR